MTGDSRVFHIHKRRLVRDEDGQAISRQLSMWFKNLVLYRLVDRFEQTPEEVAEALAAHAARPCGGLDAFTYGWTPPLGRLGSELVHAASGCTLLCACREERLLPAAVIKEELEDRVARIEASQGRVVRSREKRKLRDEVYFDLMPKAFTRSRFTHAYLAPASGWLVVDASNATRAEELVVLLGRSLEGLAVEPFGARAPAVAMTEWLTSGQLPDGFAVGDECELREPKDGGGVVRIQREDLGASEVQMHLRAGKQVQRLALDFEARLSFVLAADLTVKRLRFLAVEELDEFDQEDELLRFDANFAFMTTELERLLERLKTEFGAV
ncbi:MAG: recombination-associated protein RdgC [Gammaproteobacteria bacterium]|nr:recombination-associated protein RdgC [Gammaproteobacteria bacterium]